jgi:uncharacterized protein YutE (UPF0331/DUF86 family)
MIDKHLIDHKLKRLEGFLRELRQVEVPSYEIFKNDIIKKRFIERNLQLSIEEMLDICKYIISFLDLPEIETYRECFEQLADKGIIHKENLTVYKEMISFRNRLIHAYENMDEMVIYTAYKKRLSDFQLFINDIRNYLCKGDI